MRSSTVLSVVFLGLPLLAGCNSDTSTTDEQGRSWSFGAGDLVVFPRGMSCTWKISTAVRKHYSFG